MQKRTGDSEKAPQEIINKKALVIGMYEIDRTITLVQCKEDFKTVSRNNDQVCSSIEMALESCQDVQEELFWWQMAFHAFPVLCEWTAAHQITHNLDSPKLIKLREILFAYLKTSILFQRQQARSDGNALQSNLGEKVIEFLICLAEEMTRNKVEQVDDKQPWASKYFGDPWGGQNSRSLAALALIRKYAMHVLRRNDNGTWSFIHPKMKETLDTAMVVEFTYINARKLAEGMEYKAAWKASMKELSESLMSHPEGTMRYTNNGFPSEQSTQTVVSKSPDWNQSRINIPAIVQLKDKLTQDELQALSQYLDEIVDLNEDNKIRLINNIQNNRTSVKGDDAFSFGTCDSNYFVQNLRTLLDNGVTLEDFVAMTDADQNGFGLRANFIRLLMNNGIEFKKLSKISISELNGIDNILSIPQHISKYELLQAREASPEKERAVQFVNTELELILKSKGGKLTI